MAMFSENQSRQLYVATSTNADVIAPVQVDSSHKATDLKAKSAGACQFIINADGNEAYFNYKGATDDGLQRSDLIKKCNVMDVRCTDAADMVHKNRKAIVTVASSLLDTGNLVAGGDYVINIEIKNYIANGDDSIKVKFGATKAAAGSSASDLYKNLALNLAKNFGREPIALVHIYLCKTDLTSPTSTSAKFIEVTDKTAASSLSDTYLGICIEEAEQPWRLGAAKQEFVNFDVIPSTIFYGGIDQTWGKVQFYGSAKYTDGTASAVTIGAPNTQPNSKMVADMEYFFHKNRGDIYGFQGWPNNIDTKYLVNAGNTDGYSFVDIHFYYEGNSHNVGKSEKTITVVGTKANLKKLIGSAAVSGGSPTPATGLYAFLEGTGVAIKTSANWSN